MFEEDLEDWFGGMRYARLYKCFVRFLVKVTMFIAKGKGGAGR
jgi:hypothetical protein